MTFGVLIDTFVNEKGTTVKVYEYLRFIDSFKMMNSSLEKLVEIFLENQFEIMKTMFATVSGENFQLLKQKGYYPYSYMSSRAKFSDAQLPPLGNWGNTLDGGNVNITESNLAHASRMWENLGCGTLQDYHDAHLKLDCALLACVCELHRELSFTTYKLDCMHFFTLPNMAEEASVRIFKANVELLTEREHLDMIELQSVVASPLSTKTGASLLITNTFQTTIAQKIINSASVLMRTICTEEWCNLKNSPSQSSRSTQKSQFKRS